MADSPELRKRLETFVAEKVPATDLAMMCIAVILKAGYLHQMLGINLGELLFDGHYEIERIIEIWNTLDKLVVEVVEAEKHNN